MTKLRRKTRTVIALLLCATTGGMAVAMAAPAKERNPLAGLSRAINRAGAAALTSDQQAQLNTLIANYQAALPDEEDEALDTAREAYNDAILAGNLTAATAQATIIANRTALTGDRLQARAQFLIGVLAVLRSGGQLDALLKGSGKSLTAHPESAVTSLPTLRCASTSVMVRYHKPGHSYRNATIGSTFVARRAGM